MAKKTGIKIKDTKYKKVFGSFAAVGGAATLAAALALQPANQAIQSHYPNQNDSLDISHVNRPASIEDANFLETTLRSRPDGGTLEVNGLDYHHIDRAFTGIYDNANPSTADVEVVPGGTDQTIHYHLDQPQSGNTYEYYSIISANFAKSNAEVDAHYVGIGGIPNGHPITAMGNTYTWDSTLQTFGLPAELFYLEPASTGNLDVWHDATDTTKFKSGGTLGAGHSNSIDAAMRAGSNGDTHIVHDGTSAGTSYFVDVILDDIYDEANPAPASTPVSIPNGDYIEDMNTSDVWLLASEWFFTYYDLEGADQLYNSPHDTNFASTGSWFTINDPNQVVAGLSIIFVGAPTIDPMTKSVVVDFQYDYNGVTSSTRQLTINYTYSYQEFELPTVTAALAQAVADLEAALDAAMNNTDNPVDDWQSVMDAAALQSILTSIGHSLPLNVSIQGGSVDWDAEPGPDEILSHINFTLDYASTYNGTISEAGQANRHYAASKTQHDILDWIANEKPTDLTFPGTPPASFDVADLQTALTSQGHVDPTRTGLTMQIVSYPVPNNDTKSITLTFRLTSPSYTSADQTITLEWAETVNEALIATVTAGDITPQFSLTDQPANSSVVYTTTNYSVGVSGVTVSNAVNYSWNGIDATKDHTVDLTVSIGTASKVITYDLNFAKALVDQAAQVAIGNFTTITISGNTRQTQMTLPASLNPSTLASNGLLLQYSTSGGTTWNDVTAQAFDIPEPNSLDAQGTDRLYIRIVAVDTNLYVVTDDGEDYLKNSGGSNQVDNLDIWFDTSAVATANMFLTGSSNDLGNHTEPTGVQYDIEYSLNGGNAPTATQLNNMHIGSANAWMSKTELLALFNGGAGNIWHEEIAGFAIADLSIRLVPTSGYALSDDRRVDIPFSNFGINEFIDISSIISDLDSLLRITGHNQAPVSSNISGITTTLANYGLEIFYTTDPGAAYGTSANWGSAGVLPANYDFFANARHLSYKILAAPGNINYELSVQAKQDITTSSGVQNIQTWVDTSVVDLSYSKFSGNTNSFTIDESNTGRHLIPDQTAVDFMYRTTGNAGLNSGWLETTDFIIWLEANPSAYRTAIEARIDPASADYVLSSDQATTTLDIDDLYSYVDVSAERTAVDNITLFGTAEVANGAAFEVSNALTNANLNALGIKLQYTLDGVTWVNANIGSVSADSINGIPSMTTGQLIHLQRPSAGADPIIRFRLTPFEDDLGNDQSPSSDVFEDWVDATKVHTSEIDSVAYINGTWDASVVVVDKDSEANALPTLVNTDPINLAGITIQGDTKNATLVETLTGGLSPAQELANQNLGKPSYDPFIKVAYSIIDSNGRSLSLREDDFVVWLSGLLTNSGGVVMNGPNPVMAYDAQGVEVPLPVANINPDWNTIQPDTVQAKWVSIDSDYKPHDGSAVDINYTGLERWTDVSALVAQAQLITSTGGHSDAVTWSSIAALLADAATLGLKVQFAVGSTQPSYGTHGSWQDAIPTTVAFEHSARRVWFQVIDNGNNHVVSDQTVHNLTSTTNIDAIDARVNTSTIDVTDIDFTVDPYNAIINEVRLDWTSVADQTVVEIVYSTDATIWRNEADFVVWLNQNPGIRVADIEAKIVVRSGAGSYIILPGEDQLNNPDTTAFHSYKDISIEVGALPGINLFGITDKANAAAYTVPAGLNTATLATRGLMLQFTVDGTDWQAASLGSISAADGAGIPTHSNGEIITLSRTNSTNPPIIRFRIVPIADEDGNNGAVPADSNDYALFADGNRMHLSDYVSANYNADLIVSDRDSDADLLAIEVITSDADFNTLTISGHTKAPTLVERFNGTMDYDAYLASLNPNKPDYSAEIKVAYSVEDTNGRTYWMLERDFVEYLRGDLTVAGANVENTSGQTVMVWDDAGAELPLPAANVAPEWNTIDITSFEAKWVSNDALRIPNNTTPNGIDSTGITMWIDIAALVAQAQADVRATGGDSGAVTWSDITALQTAATALGLQVEFSHSDTQPTWASTASWNSALDTNVNFIHNTRKLWVKFDDNGSGNVVSDQVVYDLTSLSDIETILAYIDVSGLDATQADLSGAQTGMDIDESSVGYNSLPVNTAAEVLYQVGASGWLNLNDFIAWFENPANTNKARTQIEVKMESSDASLYIIRPIDIVVGSPIIDNLYSYVDIASERTFLSNIQLFGTAEVPNGAAYSVDASLSNANLNAIGIKMQYTLDGTNWVNANVANVAADGTNGIPAIANGQLVHLTRPNQSSAPIIRFRLVPFEDDLGNDLSPTGANANVYNNWVDATHVHTSEVDTQDYIAGTWDDSVVIVNKDSEADTLPALVNTDPAGLAYITIIGNSKFSTITETLTVGGITAGEDLANQNPAKPDYEPFIKIAYSIIDSNGRSLSLRMNDFTAWLAGTFTNSGGVVMNGSNPVLGYDALGSEQAWPVANIFPDWNTIQPDTVEAMWVSIDPLYKPNNSAAVPINTTGFERWTDVTALETQGQAILATGGHSDAVVWSDITTLVSDAAVLGLKVQFAVGLTQPSYNTGTWSDTIPTNVNFFHADRRLWFQIIDDNNNHVVSNQVVHNLTSTSNIDAIDARVVTTSVDVNDSIFTVDPLNANINEAAVDWTSVEDPSVVEIVYTGDAGATWHIESDFVAWMNANPEIMVGDIQAQIVVKAIAGAYIILPGEENLGAPTVTDFYSYKDISTQSAALANITLHGITDKTDSAAYVVPNELRTSLLSADGLMLQFTVDGTTWEAAALGTISPGDGAGIPSSNDGQLVTISRTNSTNPPIIRFRIVPIDNEAGQDGGVSVNEDDYMVFVDTNKMNLSDYVAGGYLPDSVVSDRDTDADALAIQVLTDPSEFNQLTISGHTKAPTLNERFTNGMDYDAYLADLNPNKPDYSYGVKIAYAVTDQVGRSYWMLQSDFVEYLRGDLTVAGANVENTSGQTVEAWDDTGTMMNLPSTHVAPDWNSLQIATFEAKWVTNTAALVPDNTTTSLIDSSAIVMWIDIAGLVTQAQADIRATGGDSDAVVWSNISALEAATAALGLDIQFSISDTQPSWASATSWTDTLETDVNFIHNTRNLWVKFIHDGTSNNEVSDQVVYDLTADTQIQDIIARINTSTLDPSNADLSGSQTGMNIDESTVGYNSIPINTAAEVQYSVGTSGWLNMNDFIAWFENPANTNKARTQIEVQLASTDGTLYVIRSGEENQGFPIIDDLYSYIDISTERTALTGIQLYGTAEVPNGAAYQVDPSLTNANLNAIGIKMQYTLDGIDWVNANVGNVADDTVNGIPSITNGELIHLTRPNQSSAPIIRFRLVPFEDDLGTDQTPSAGDFNVYNNWVDATNVHTSEVNTPEYIAGTWDSSVVIENLDAAADALPALVITDPTNLAGITIQGDSKITPTLVEILSGNVTPGQDLGTQNPGKPDYEPFIKIAYSIIDVNGRSLSLRQTDFIAWLNGTFTDAGGVVMNGITPVTGYDSIGTPIAWPVANIFPDWNTIEPNTVEAMWVSIDTQYKANNSTPVLINSTIFYRWTDVTGLEGLGQAITATGGDSDLVTWSDITNLLTDATTLGLKVQFAVGPNQPSYNTGAWSDTIPTNVDFFHASRRLWFQIIDDGNTHVVSNPVVHNLTSTSNIATIDARVVTTSVDVNDAIFTVDPLNANINEAAVDWTSVEDPSVVEIVYTGDGGTTWHIESDFVAWMNANPEIMVRDIQAQIVVKAIAGAYIIRAGEENLGAPTTTDFYSYKDITAYSTELVNIDLYGIVDKANAAAFTVPNALRTLTLSNEGLMLQFTLDGTDWQAASLGSISSADGVGIPSHADGQIITINIPNSTNPPIIRFRIVPIEDEAGTGGGTSTGEDDYMIFVDNNKMNLSDYVAGGYNPATVIEDKDNDAAVLAREVLTDVSSFLDITIIDDTKHPILTEEINGLDYAGYLASLNPNKPDYSYGVQIAYSVVDGTGRSYWMLEADFVEYLRGDLTVAGAVVEDTSGQTVVAWDDAGTMMNLPTTHVAPDWNSIDITTFEAKWTTNTSDLVPNNITSAPIDASNMVMWIDIAGLVTQAQADIRATGGDSDDVVWSSTAALEAAAAALGLKVEYSINDTIPSWGNNTSWEAALNTDVNFIHNTRKVWVKFLDDGLSGNVVSAEVVYDLTALSQIEDIIARIDTTTLNPQASQLIGNETLLTIDESGVGYNTLPINDAAEVLYSVGASGWINWADFKIWFEDPTNTNKPRAQIEVKLETTDATLYVVRPGDEKQTSPVIDDLYSYNDVSLEVIGMNNIQLHGVLGKADGVAYEVPTNLTTASLNARGLKLQYTLDNTLWNDSTLAASIPSDPVNGIGNIPANHGELITIPKPVAGNPVIAFRLVSIKDDEGNTNTVLGDDYIDYVEANKVHLSDYVAAGYNPAGVEIDQGNQAANLPTLVITAGTDNYLDQITIQGDSRDATVGETFTVNGTPGGSWADVLAHLNPANDFSPVIRIAYSISDGNGQPFYLEESDFERWLGNHFTVSGTNVVDGSTIIWGWDGAGTYMQMPTAQVSVDYNEFDYDTYGVQAKWVSNDTLFRPTDTQSTMITFNPTSFKKWIDVQAYIDRLEVISITGHTRDLQETEIANILSDITAEFGANHGIQIESTNNIVGTTPDWSNASIDSLPPTMNLLYELAFRITDNGNSKHAVSTEAIVGSFDPHIIWDQAGQNATANIDKFINVDRDLLAQYLTMNGDTLNIDSIEPTNITNADDDGEMSASGTFVGVEVLYAVKGVTGINENAMPIDLFREYLSNRLSWQGGSPVRADGVTVIDAKYGFTAANINVYHDGTWGRDSIFIGYTFLPGFYIDPSQDGELGIMDKQVITTTVDRYIDITSLTDEAEVNGGVQVTGDATRGWWNAVTGAYDDMKTWGGYVDSQDLRWDISTLLNNPGALHAVIEYQIDGGAWTTTPDTSTIDVHGNRELRVRFVNGANYATGEAPVLSDYSFLDVSLISRIQDVETHVNVTNPALSNTSLSGLTNGPLIDESGSVVPQNSDIHYSLTEFKDVNHSDSLARLAMMGLDTPAKITASGYSHSMTSAEFETFITNNNSNPDFTQVIRSLITLRLAADPDYSVTPGDDAGSRSTPDVDALYTYKDVANLTSQFVYQTGGNPGDPGGIGLFGQKTTTDGVAVSLPNSLTLPVLAQSGLKLQFTMDSDDGLNMKPGASWTDAVTSVLSSGGKPGVPTTIPNGFWVTMVPQAGGNSFIGFRIVPIEDDLGNVTNTDTPTWTLDQFFEATKTKPQDHNGTDVQDVYSIDTTQIPTVVNTDSTWLSNIQFSGSTRYATIHEDMNGFDPSVADSINDMIDTINTDTSLKNSLEVWYALDKLDGTAIAGAADVSDGVWLIKADMEAYLNGDLEIFNNSVVYRSNRSQVVDALTNATHMRAEPDYINLDIDQIWSKWISTNPSYIPSDTLEVNHVSVAGLQDASSFRKWFDGEEFRTAVNASIARGHTESYQIDLDTLGRIDQAELTRHGLQLELALDPAGPWTTTLPDFMTADWQKQVDRFIFGQVVPTGSNVSTDFTASDRLIIEYNNIKYNTVTTDSTIGGVRELQLYVDVAKVELAAIDVKGNQYKLDDGNGDESLGLDEDLVDDNTEKYTQVEIQYLFDGTWYNKADLISEMTRIRNLARTGAVTMPSDFGHNNVSAKWVILDTNDAVIAPGEDAIEAAKADLLKDFINFWDVQDENSLFVNGPAEYDLMGSINAATLNWAVGGSLGANELIAYGLTAQWTTVENPSQDINALEWQDADSTATVLSDVLLDPNHRSLWLRFIPTNTTTHDSSTFASLVGNDTIVQSINIDTSAMRYAVTVDSSVFLTMPISGDTQNITMDNSQYVGAPWHGITMENVDSSGNSVAVPDAEKPQWFTDVGLTTQVRVVATRTQGGYIAGTTYEFNNFQLFSDALITKDLNFDRSTLEVSWGIIPTKGNDFTVSDQNWVRPTDADTLVNIVYTEDITTLYDESYLIGGNNLLLGVAQNDIALDPASLLALGVKIQYNIEDNHVQGVPDATTWTDTVPTFLHEDKNIWIQFAPINADYDLGDDALIGEQVMKLKVADVKVAIILDTAWMDQLTDTSLAGNTWEINWDNPWPTVPESFDPGNPGVDRAFGYPEFTIEQDNGAGGVIWGQDGTYLSDILLDQYGKDIMLDKDRDPHVRMQYIIQPGMENDYEFTDPTGAPRSLANLTKTVDIQHLEQPVFTDWRDSRIGNIDWLTMANSPEFKAMFTPGSTDLTADLESILYNGENVGANGNDSFYDLDVNIYDLSDRAFRDAINALAPRNTTFEFRTRSSATGNWGGWSSTIPTDVIRSTIYAGFEVRIVADAGFYLPDGNNGTGWLGAWGDQTWTREYNVVVEKNTEGVQANTATFVGFDTLNGAAGTGRFLTDDPDKNYNNGLPILDILAKDGSLFLDLWEPSPAYVLEYRVTDRFGVDRVWTDENFVTAAGWHAFATPPSSSMDPFGHKPVDLMNGDVVHMRLRARNGYVIIDPGSDDPVQSDPDWNGYVSWSEATTFPTVSGLVQEIDKSIVDSQQFYDAAHPEDMDGNPITNDTNMPQVSFSGNEDSGTVNITTGRTAISNQFDVEIMVLEPLVPSGFDPLDAVDENQKPTFGYIVRNQFGNPVTAYLTAGGVSNGQGTTVGWQDGFDEVQDVWVDPNTVNDLYVGSAILPRIIPKSGYGFKWEDTDNNFDDEDFPKYTAEYYYNRNLPGEGQGEVLEDFTPIPVRGLLLYPPTIPSAEHLVYSTLDYQMINGNAQLEMSFLPIEGVDKWQWRFDLIRRTNGSSLSDIGLLPDANPTGKNDIYNGDSVFAWIAPVNPSYVLDPAFIADNGKHEMIVTGLKDEIQTENIPRPLLTLDGYEGEAILSDIQEQSDGGLWQEYDRSGPGLPTPVLDPASNPGGGVKWEYQIFTGNPTNALSSIINAIPWSDQVPTGLADGQWVRARIAPIVPSEIVYPALYSFGSQEQPGDPEHHIGWTQIDQLYINPDNLEPESRVTGYDYKTAFTIGDSGGLDDNAVIWEASYNNGLWYEQPDWLNPPFTELYNGATISIRARADSQFRFNPTDHDTNGPISVFEDPNRPGEYIAQHEDWVGIEVSGLLNYLDVSQVTIDQVTVVRDHRHPTADEIINNPDDYPAMDPDNDILNGYATLTESKINNLFTVEDVNGSTVDGNGNPYSDLLELRYMLRRFDIDSGNLAPAVEWLPSTGTLGINDEITVEVVSTNEDYALSRTIRRTIVVSGLIQAPPENQAAPILSFAGESGEGTVNVTPAANSGYKWQYITWREGEDEPDFTDQDNWWDTPPVDLENGWNVAVKLASTIGGIITDDYNTGWVLVTGLRQRIDLSGVRVLGFDSLNPFDPVKIVGEDNIYNVAFKMVGDQEGHAYLDINSPIVSSNPAEQLRDLNGETLPFADFLQWEFAYSTSSGNSSVSAYSYSLPRGLRNGTLIHARLAPKDGVDGIETYGFQTITIVVDMLQTEATVSNQLMILLAVGAGGALAFTSLIALGVAVKTRKKRMI